MNPFILLLKGGMREKGATKKREKVVALSLSDEIIS
jgi:hypothetical protein